MLAGEIPTSTADALTETQEHTPGVGPDKFTPNRSDRLKRAFDLTFGLVMLGLAAPVVAMIWAAVRLTSSGPGFYSQVRVGRDGRHYRIYKIRTMTHNCELSSGAQWCQQRDPRVTALGRILRRLHLDELPQLWNIVRGDMSLVGPRPERPEFVGPLSEEIPGYTERQRVRPGLTGLAQIQLPADSGIESVRTKLVLDRCYVENRSLWLDARIMFGTALYLLGFSYATVRRVMRLPNPLTETATGNRPPQGGAPEQAHRSTPPTKKVKPQRRVPAATRKA